MSFVFNTDNLPPDPIRRSVLRRHTENRLNALEAGDFSDVPPNVDVEAWSHQLHRLFGKSYINEQAPSTYKVLGACSLSADGLIVWDDVVDFIRKCRSQGELWHNIPSPPTNVHTLYAKKPAP